MPGFTGIKAAFEAQPGVGVLGFGLALRWSNGYCVNEVGVTIACPKLLLRLRPRRGDPTAAYDLARIHLENVGEVTTERDLKQEAYPPHAMVGNVEILVHAAIDAAADNKSERALRD